jgi:hypothetical protein
MARSYLHSVTSRQERIRVSARAGAWTQHISCTHPIAGCRDRSRIVGRQRYSGRWLYQVSPRRLYQECQAASWSRGHWCSKTKECQTDNNNICRPSHQNVPSITRVAAGALGFLIFSHTFDGPDLYGASSFFETIPSRPSLQTASNSLSP